MDRLMQLWWTLLAAILFAGCVTDDVDDEPQWEITVGSVVPQFSVTLNGGSVVTTADLKGHTSLIAFFNTACSDCRQELPVLQEVYDNTKGKIVFMCIARDQGREDIDAYWQEAGLSMPYSPQPDRTIFELFATQGIPRIYVISPDLHIKAAFSPESMPKATELLRCLGL